SRRRHTRFSRDWSSDVCSSDLSPGIIGTVMLICIVLIIAILILFYRLSETLGNIIRKKDYRDKTVFSEELMTLSEPEIDEILEKRKKALGYQLSGNELSNDSEVEDTKGLIAKVTHKRNMPL